MARPFLVVGAMKSGTTTLDALLRGHPEVEVVAEKESSQLLNSDTAKAFAQRVNASSASVAGEITAGYLQAPVVTQPVSTAYNLWGQSVAIIAIVRDPVDRAVSHWQHLRHLGRETRGPAEALLDPEAPYLAFSRYHQQLAPWRDAFGTDRVLVIRLEDYAEDPGQVETMLWKFLGVSELPGGSASVHANAGAERVVATGWRGTVRGSTVYRAAVRPLLRPSVRRSVAKRLGGGKGRETASVDPVVRRAFADLLSDDTTRLSEDWPHLRWETQ